MIDKFDVAILISHLLEMIIGNLLYTKGLERKYNKIKHYSICSLIYLAAWTLFSKNNWLLNLIYTLFFNCIITGILFNGKISYKIYYSLYYCINLCLTEFL